MSANAARLEAYVNGIAVTLSLPLWLRRGGSGMARLVKDGAAPAMPRGNHRDHDEAVWAAHAALRVLARARLPWWRNTCLFRAVAECVVLRRYGIPSRVELGVARPGDGSTIGAHAWVVRGDAAPAPAAVAMTVLR